MPALKWLPSLDGLQPYQPGKPIEEVRREYGLSDVVKLASNENPLGPSPKGLKAALRAAAQSHRYPDGSAAGLRSALARRWNLPADRFTFGNGSNEILILAAQAFCGQGDRVVFSQHSFSVYSAAAHLARARAVEVPSPDFTHDLEALALQARRARLVFVCNPNNPTGSWHPASAIGRFLQRVPRECLVVLDEAYAEYAGQSPAQDKAWLARHPNLLICRTFSKAYGLAGFRVGYGLAAPAIIEGLEKARQPFNLNRPAAAAAEAALGDDAFVRRTLALNRAGLRELEAFFAKLGLWHLPSAANFIFFKPPSPRAAGGKPWFPYLLSKGVIVRPFGACLRVTTGLPGENRKFVKAFLSGLAHAL